MIASPDAHSLTVSFEEDNLAAAWLESLQQAICQANNSFDLVRNLARTQHTQYNTSTKVDSHDGTHLNLRLGSEQAWLGAQEG